MKKHTIADFAEKRLNEKKRRNTVLCPFPLSAILTFL